MTFDNDIGEQQHPSPQSSLLNNSNNNGHNKKNKKRKQSQFYSLANDQPSTPASDMNNNNKHQHHNFYYQSSSALLSYNNNSSSSNHHTTTDNDGDDVQSQTSNHSSMSVLEQIEHLQQFSSSSSSSSSSLSSSLAANGALPPVMMLAKKQQQQQHLHQNHQHQEKIRLNMRERLMRIRRSHIFTLYFITIIPLCLFLLIYALVRRDAIEQIWYVSLEGVATLMLYVEFLINLLIDGARKTVSSFFSLLHFVTLVACTVMFSILVVGLFLGHTSVGWSLWGNVAYMQEIVIGVQCITNVVRIIVWLYQTNKRRKVLFGGRVLLEIPGLSFSRHEDDGSGGFLAPVDDTDEERIAFLSEGLAGASGARIIGGDGNGGSSGEVSASVSSSTTTRVKFSPTVVMAATDAKGDARSGSHGDSVSQMIRNKSFKHWEHCESLCHMDHQNVYCSSFEDEPVRSPLSQHSERSNSNSSSKQQKRRQQEHGGGAQDDNSDDDTDESSSSV